MKIFMTIEIPDPSQEMEVEDGLSEDEIQELVDEFADEHAAQTKTVTWYKEE